MQLGLKLLFEFYERRRQGLLGSGSYRCADYCSHRDTGLGGVHCDQVYYLGPSAEEKFPDLGRSDLGKTLLHPRTQEEGI